MPTWREADAETATFLALVPPSPLITDIVDLQRRVGLATSTEPHITVKAQVGLEGDEWQAPVVAALTSVPAFSVGLGPVGRFGDGIVFLTVPGGEVVALHHHIIDAVPGPRFEYEGDAYVPHLTLAADFVGATRDQLAEVARRADAERWRSFVAESVSVFRRDGHGAEYRIVDEIPLAG